MTTPGSNLEFIVLEQLRARFPELYYMPSNRFCWSPLTREIGYDEAADDSQATAWSLLHETGHALLGHDSYLADFELIKLEMAAWTKARELATDFDIVIDEEHIQDCLDTYRDWLYKRSVCPQCGNKALQQNDYVHYRCFNCHKMWRVTPSRFCRAYRATKHLAASDERLVPVFGLKKR